jgi:MoxR-like ATPase
MAQDENKPRWWIFGNDGPPRERLARLPAAPPWRRFDEQARAGRGKRFIPRSEEIDLVNAALYLRRPLLITGKPGVGKTSLTYSVAEDLELGEVLRWSITTSTTLRDGLYRYDAIARLQDASLEQTSRAAPASAAAAAAGGRKSDAAQANAEHAAAPPIGRYLRLGPLGTAFAASHEGRPRVLLIDEIDKSDIDLPNNLLHIFEEGEFTIPELERLPQEKVSILPADAPAKATPETHGIRIKRGHVRCEAFPFVVMTSNAEREFPPAFLRRCLKLDMAVPSADALGDIVKIHLFGPGSVDRDLLDKALETRLDSLIGDFLKRRDTASQDLAADQLLNAVYMVLRDADPEKRYGDRRALTEALWRPLSE